MTKKYIYIMLILIMALFTGCPDLLTPPVDDDELSLSEVSNLQTTYSDSMVLLFYVEPSDAGYVSTELTFTPIAAGVTQPITLLKGEGITLGKSIIAAGGLTNGTEYTLTLKAVYTDGSRSTGLTALITPLADVPIPLNVGAAEGDGEIVLSWDEPTVNNWFGVEVTFLPEDIDALQPIGVFTGTTSVSITGLDNDTTYTFDISAYDFVGEYSNSITIDATPSSAGNLDPPFNNSLSTFFIDTDSQEGEISGACIIEKAVDESDIDNYILYWGSSSSVKLNGEASITSIPVTGSDLTYSILENTSIPVGASHLLVFSENINGEIVVPNAINLVDLVIEQESYTGEINPIELDSTWYTGINDGTDNYDLLLLSGSDFQAIPALTTSWTTSPENLASFNSKLMFTAQDENVAQVYWEYDPDLNSAQKVTVTQEECRSGLVYNNEFYFPQNSAANGTSLYVYDGTNTPTLAYDLDTESTDQDMRIMCEYNGNLIFVGSDSTIDEQLYSFNGTNADPITSFSGSGSISIEISTLSYLIEDNILYFCVTEYDEVEDEDISTDLYSYNGSTVTQITDFGDTGGTILNLSDSLPSMSGYNDLLVYKDTIYFSATDGTDGAELWSFDGSQVSEVFDFYPGDSIVTSGMPIGFQEYNNYLFFGAANSTEGHHLYLFDGVHDPVSLEDFNSATAFYDNLTYSFGLIDGNYIVGDIDYTLFTITYYKVQMITQ